MLKLCLASALLPLLSSFAAATELTGRYGFLGEWEIEASLTERPAEGRGREFAGDLTMRHTAVCGPGEKPVKAGNITLAVRRDRYSAKLRLEDAECRFDGTLSDEKVVFIKCGGEQSIPIRLWWKDGAK
ncbi:hypothetical protein [Bosea sp. BH3]|uniref:hypothetical protein n=1 Tax=Bosea sp. BH3 TaxID=2871701 RepID=UPI0021CB13C1|nr:hypothetical protein [Bosea sp. BH3]MCU4178203.1 hypothetical protein [Bosea sp. BH3]